MSSGRFEHVFTRVPPCMRLSLCVAASWLVCGCGRFGFDASCDSGPDAAPDARPPDAGSGDAGPRGDAGPADGGPPDGGPPDAGTPDAGPAPPIEWRDDFTEYAGWSSHDTPYPGWEGPVTRTVVADGAATDGSALQVSVALRHDMIAQTYRRFAYPSPVRSVTVEFRIRQSYPGPACRVSGYRAGVFVFSRDVDPAVDFWWSTAGWWIDPPPGAYEGRVMDPQGDVDTSPYTVTTGTVTLAAPSTVVTVVLVNVDNSNICTYDGWWDYVRIVGNP